MGASATNAVSRAIELTKQRLFPFKLEKWLHVGFIAFLAGLGEGGYSYGSRIPGMPGTSGSPSPADFGTMFSEVERFIQEHSVWLWIGGAAVLAVGVALGALLTWVSSRGEFMFIESVVHDRTAVSEPWQRLKEPAWGLFKVRFGISLVAGALSLFGMAAAVLLTWADLRTGNFGPALWVLLPIGAGVFAIILPVTILIALLRDFVAPIMYLDGVGVGAAWRSFRETALAGNLGALLLFYVLKAALSLASGVVALFALCLTCCIAALPYVGTVVLLPVHVFFRVFSLYMLEELGRPVFPRAEPAYAAWAGQGAYGDGPERFPGS